MNPTHPFPPPRDDPDGKIRDISLGEISIERLRELCKEFKLEQPTTRAELQQNLANFSEDKNAWESPAVRSHLGRRKGTKSVKKSTLIYLAHKGQAASTSSAPSHDARADSVSNAVIAEWAHAILNRPEYGTLVVYPQDLEVVQLPTISIRGPLRKAIKFILTWWADKRLSWDPKAARLKIEKNGKTWSIPYETFSLLPWGTDAWKDLKSRFSQVKTLIELYDKYPEPEDFFKLVPETTLYTQAVKDLRDVRNGKFKAAKQEPQRQHRWVWALDELNKLVKPCLPLGGLALAPRIRSQYWPAIGVGEWKRSPLDSGSLPDAVLQLKDGDVIWDWRRTRFLGWMMCTIYHRRELKPSFETTPRPDPGVELNSNQRAKPRFPLGSTVFHCYRAGREPASKKGLAPQVAHIWSQYWPAIGVGEWKRSP
ncbi:hypothetical protein C8R47DRAFT_1217136 [Mycena vitilis]|nr:hypothetical protein C8R47DRAFT_1217136 [Mycena vitilis]